MSKRKAFVTCQNCDLEHEILKVTTLNIEEDESGRDKVTFECPVCEKVRVSLIIIHL